MTTFNDEILRVRDVPLAWADLIEGLTLLGRGCNNEVSPLCCEHDMLTVMADPADFNDEETERLETLGFRARP